MRCVLLKGLSRSVSVPEIPRKTELKFNLSQPAAIPMHGPVTFFLKRSQFASGGAGVWLVGSTWSSPATNKTKRTKRPPLNDGQTWEGMSDWL